jgi:hypothetical protein
MRHVICICEKCDIYIQKFDKKPFLAMLKIFYWKTSQKSPSLPIPYSKIYQKTLSFSKRKEPLEFFLKNGCKEVACDPAPGLSDPAEVAPGICRMQIVKICMNNELCS